MRRRRPGRRQAAADDYPLDADALEALDAEEWHVDGDPFAGGSPRAETRLFGDVLAVFRMRLVSAIREGRVPPPIVVRTGPHELTLRIDGQHGSSLLDVSLRS